MNAHNAFHRGTPRPRGFLLVAVLACMVIATAIVLGVVQQCLRARHQMRHELQMEQTRWVLDAASAYAAQRVAADPTYEGETQSLTPALRLRQKVTVQIKVQRLNDSGRAVLTVSARLAGEDPADQTTQRTRTIDLD